ncbi:PAS domain-containing sensor histidine kinase [Halarcobacter mediterraneus]|uniref:histidine kinase n=1 Tax=Halarcobacter mediterraneus TaxID=2023153 RepID=A0A4Q1B0D7_9BACT|nr:PAS domain S-box protein [Halarcobacter mediterraneus]RXK11924.1 PAS domain-containing sensor histidine kinase [Halarcobacter mediterraneus]
MKVQFSFKLFLAFILFSILLFCAGIFLSYKTFQVKIEQSRINSFINKSNFFEKELKKIVHINNNILISISKSNSFKDEHIDSLFKEIKVLMLSNENIVDLKIIKKDGKKILSLEQNNKEIKEKPLSLSPRIYYYLNSEQIKKNELFFTEPYLKSLNNEVVMPIKPLIDFVLKTDSKIIFLSFNIDDFIKSINKMKYLIDKDLNIIYDSTGINSWSYYYNPDLNIRSVVEGFSNKIFKKSFSFTNKYYFKQIFIKNLHYFTLVDANEKTSLKSFFFENKDSFYSIFFLMAMISFILSMLFTTPLSSINRKLESEKDLLTDSIKRNNLILNDSLELLNQHVMFIKFDSNFVITDVSNYFSRVSGFQKEELIGQNYTSILNKYSIKIFNAEISYILKNTGTWSGELISIKKMSSDYWVKSNIQSDVDENDNIIGYTEIRSDITDNKRIERLYNDLNYQIEQLNAIVQNANSGIALLDLNGNFRRFNEAFYKLLNYNENEVVEKTILDLVDSSSIELLEKIMKEVKEFGSISNLELVFQSKNFEEVHLDVSLKVLPDKKNIVMVVNSLEDKRKLQELNQNLEQRVEEEVKKNMEKDKLHQEEQIKNAKLTSIGTLSAGITHEINTPLTYLKGNFEMLIMDIEDLEDNPMKEDMLINCEKITEAINRIAVIVESMREMSQTSTETKEKANIFATLFTSLTMAYNVSKQVSKVYLNNKEFTPTSIDKNDFKIYAKVQKQRLEQVWIIIINNALDELKNNKEYEERKLDITVFEEKDEVVVKFCDNAGGIKEDIIDNIFEPFVSSKTHSGMGVGLNIAKKIIDEQEGKILAYNSLNGAIFEIRLKSQE